MLCPTFYTPETYSLVRAVGLRQAGVGNTWEYTRLSRLSVFLCVCHAKHTRHNSNPRCTRSDSYQDQKWQILGPKATFQVFVPLCILAQASCQQGRH